VSLSPSVRVFVRTLFFSFSVFGVCSALFQGSFKGILRKFQGCFKDTSRVFQGSFKKVSRVFQGSFEGDSSKF